MLKNIIVVCDSASVRGGIEGVAFTEAKGLAKQGLNVYLFAAMGPIDKTLEENGVRVTCLWQQDILSNPNRMEAVKQGLYNVKAHDELKNFLRDFNPLDTIVHVHGWTKALSSSVFSASAYYGFKVVITIHDYFSVCPNGGFYNYPKKKICDLRPLSMRCICRNCDSRSYPTKLFRVIRSFMQRREMFKNKQLYFIYISRITHDAVIPLIKRYIKDAFFLRNPAQIESTQPVNITDNDTYLFIARLSLEKGVELFCQAMTDLGLKGCVLGDGYLRGRMERRYPNVVFEGWVEGKKKEKLIRKGKCLVFPSLWYEGSPLTILEMMSYGIPCIVPDKCAASDEVIDGKTGYIFKSGDLVSLEEAIRRYEKTDLTKMQQNIQKVFNTTDCSPKTHVTNLLHIYASIFKDEDTSK